MHVYDRGTQRGEGREVATDPWPGSQKRLDERAAGCVLARALAPKWWLELIRCTMQGECVCHPAAGAGHAPCTSLHDNRGEHLCLALTLLMHASIACRAALCKLVGHIMHVVVGRALGWSCMPVRLAGGVCIVPPWRSPGQQQPWSSKAGLLSASQPFRHSIQNGLYAFLCDVLPLWQQAYTQFVSALHAKMRRRADTTTYAVGEEHSEEGSS